MKKYSLAFNGVPFDAYYTVETSEVDKLVATLKEIPCYGLDIETAKKAEYLEDRRAGLDPHLTDIRLIQIYDGEKVAVFDLFHVDITKCPSLLQFLRTKRFVAHNAIFEIKHLTHNGIKPDVGCSLLLAMLVDRAERSPFEKEEDDDYEPDGMSEYRRGYSLDAVTARLFGVKVDKFFQTANWNTAVLPKEQVLYAALDAVLTFKVAEVLVPKVNLYKMGKTYRLLKETQYAICEMELNGMELDEEAHQDLIREWSNADRIAQAQCKELIPVANLNSTTQLERWAQRHFHKDIVVRWPKTPTGKFTFNRNKILHLADDPAIAALLEHKKYFKLLTTYGTPLHEQRNPKTDRIHTQFNLGGTRTGRLSSRDPNLQNLPRDASVRNIFTAGQGRTLVVADFGQIEMRVAGELSRDPAILDAYATGKDLHALMAANILGKQVSTVTKQDRQLAKAVNFGLLFGMGSDKLRTYAKTSYDVDMSVDLAEHAVKLFRTTYAVYGMWQRRQREYCTKLGFVRTPCGKMRKLTEEEVYTKAVNTPVQGGAAEVMFYSLCNFVRRSDGKFRLLNCVHDEMIIDCAEGDEEEAKECLELSMIDGMLQVFPNATTVKLVEAKAGKSWGECKGG